MATASSPQVAVKFRMITLEQLSGSMPSVLGDNSGAEKFTFSTKTISQAKGWTAQKGGFSTVTPINENSLQYIGSMRRGRL
mmetsp:Transcript_13744/g.25569  ORF Transcript_13744/g.25569 Transcript_13744/m.25569 type:complete len:81 (+) Transcript_13744:615-857(+)